MAEYPELGAVWLFGEGTAAGHASGYDQLKRYVREVRPRGRAEPVQRLETPPGHQAQMDFAEFRLPWGKRHASLLGYSPAHVAPVLRRGKMAVMMRWLEAAFRCFRGAEILFDQAKAIIGEAGRDLVSDDDLNAWALRWPSIHPLAGTRTRPDSRAQEPAP